MLIQYLSTANASVRGVTSNFIQLIRWHLWRIHILQGSSVNLKTRWRSQRRGMSGFRSFRQSPTASGLGNTTALSTTSATNRSGSSGDSKASAEIFSRFEKLDALFLSFLNFALIIASVNTP